jgi:hypothetical protein
MVESVVVLGAEALRAEGPRKKAFIIIGGQEITLALALEKEDTVKCVDTDSSCVLYI